MYFCNSCKEHWFDEKRGKTNTTECTDYETARKNTNNSCRKFAAENNIDPYQDGFPYHLQSFLKSRRFDCACLSCDEDLSAKR
eukprot:11686669-Ditylum_brightwellii.AAC.1